MHVVGSVSGEGIIKPVIAFQGRVSWLVANLANGMVLGGRGGMTMPPSSKIPLIPRGRVIAF